MTGLGGTRSTRWMVRVVIGVVVVLVGAGVAIRYLRYHPHAPMVWYGKLIGKRPHFVEDPELGWVPSRNLDQTGKDPDDLGEHRFRTDASGFRNRDLAADFDGTRLVLLGDSMVWGLGVDQDKIAGSRLQQRLGDSYEVITLGSPGWSTDQEYLAFSRWVLPLQPEVVFWFITPINDIVCNGTGQAGFGVMYRKPRFVLEPSGALRFVPIDRNATARPMGDNLEQNMSMLSIFYRHAGESLRDLLRLTGAILRRGGREWTSRGIRVYFVLFKPHLVTRDARSLEDYAVRFGHDPGDFSFEVALTNMGFMAEYAGIDLYYFDTRADQRFVRDHHLNEDGHRALADLVMRIMDGQVAPKWKYGFREW